MKRVENMLPERLLNKYQGLYYNANDSQQNNSRSKIPKKLEESYGGTSVLQKPNFFLNISG